MPNPSNAEPAKRVKSTLQASPTKRPPAKPLQKKRPAQTKRPQRNVITSQRKTKKQTAQAKRREQTKPTQKPRKRYRRTIRLRPCVLPMTFLVPLGIILLEHYFGILFSLDHVKDVYYEQMGVDPWQVDLPPSERIADVRPILNLTYTPQRPPCRAGLRRMINVHNPKSHSVTYRKIPMIVHQTSKSRCLTTHFDRATVRWAFRRWSYYFHDDDAVDRLLRSDFPEFPHLKLVVEHCLASRSARLGLWRHLVLWVYGGVYADLNTYPAHFNATTLQDMDDGFFLIDPDSQVLSTELMAMSPRHPLMYYAVQHAIDNVLRMRTAALTNPRELTAEGALHQAMEDFKKGSADTKKTAAASNSKGGIVQGFQGHSIRVAGSVGGPEEYITPLFITEAGNRKEFGKMGMESTNEPIHNIIMNH